MVSSCTYNSPTLNTYNFCVTTDHDFITSWLKHLFTQSEIISKANASIHEPLFEQYRNLKGLVESKAASIPVIGFNLVSFRFQVMQP